MGQYEIADIIDCVRENSKYRYKYDTAGFSPDDLSTILSTANSSGCLVDAVDGYLAQFFEPLLGNYNNISQLKSTADEHVIHELQWTNAADLSEEPNSLTSLFGDRLFPVGELRAVRVENTNDIQMVMHCYEDEGILAPVMYDKNTPFPKWLVGVQLTDSRIMLAEPKYIVAALQRICGVLTSITLPFDKLQG